MRQKDNTKNTADFLDLFPVLKEADSTVRNDFSRVAKLKDIPAKKILYSSGDECRYFALVISGSIRVFCNSPSGSEVTYYRVRKGECCVLTASCLMNGSTFPAVAVAEDDVQAMVLPSSVIREWTQKYEVWNQYILSTISGKMARIAGKLNHLNFCRLDCRIASVILEKAAGDRELKITHSDIALEIGTAREVVSRTLKEFEKKKYIKMSRNNIEILDASALKNCIESC